MPLLIAAVAFVLLLIVLIPLSLLLRYRTGTSRRRARRWIVTLNVVGLVMSSAFLLIVAAIMNVWVPEAFLYASGSLATGGVLGLFGLWLTRWDSTPGALHYTPNRWLVLLITLVVAARIVYGFARAWYSWRAGADSASWVVASGAAGSLAAGAVVIGYYLVYWWGVRRRLFSAAIRFSGPAGGVSRPKRMS